MIEEKISVNSRASPAKASRRATLFLLWPVSISRRKEPAFFRFLSANFGAHKKVFFA